MKTEQNKNRTKIKINGIYRCSVKDDDTEIMIVTGIENDDGVPTLYGETLHWVTNDYQDSSEHWSYNISGVNSEEGYKFEYLGQKEDFPEYFL